ncbi:MAG TPA: hypothetical protein VHD55_01655 [Candidatus Paceibacterota bacterium]|nr:hypothetical protein [Candidatus Paceibacterota bacterium]
MESAFSIKESFAFGWQKTREHSGLLFGAMLTIFALQVAQALVTATLMDQLIGVLALVAVLAAECVAGVGFVLIMLKIAKGERAQYADILPPVRLVWTYLLASLAAGLLILLGFVLLIIPGIYLSLRFSMVRFAVLEGAGVKESLKKSGAMTRGVKWKLLGFLLLCGLVNMLGAILLMVGLLVTVPVSTIAYAHVYRKLHAHHHAHA